MTASSAERDVVVIGAGVVGTAIARELTRFRLRVTLLEAGRDVGAGTSKANTALLHTGFDAKPGTIEAGLVRRGFDLLGAYAARVGIPVERTGALLVAWDDAQLAALPGIAAVARENGHDDLREVEAGELRAREPHLGPGARGALEVPGESIVDPFTPPIAFATEAVLAGCELRRGARVTGLDRGADGWDVAIEGDPRPLRTRFVVNAAGLRSDEVHRLAGFDGFTVTPRRGELIVYDRLARPLVNHIVLAVPTATTKGVLVAPTVFGGVMVGPTADDIADKTATGSTAAGLERLRAEAGRIMPALRDHEVTAVYAGLRAATEHVDYRLGVDAGAAYACAGGIRSTGLSASMAIAEHVRDGLEAAGLELDPRPDDELPRLRVPNLGEAFPRPYQQGERIAADPEYGRVVCFCERVTRGEIRDALHSPVPPADLDGLRRRTRALMGRCQGFFCGAEVTALMEASR
jgi:glycerol-3-phosphate dehydrogenase